MTEPKRTITDWVFIIVVIVAIILGAKITVQDWLQANNVQILIPKGIVDMDIIKQIESSCNPRAINERSGARGLYQLREIAWQDVQRYYDDLDEYGYYEYAFDPIINELFAQRYIALLEKYLKNYGIPLNLMNLIVVYNWGIGNTVKWHANGGGYDRLPKETRDYYEKYLKLSNLDS